MSNEVRLVSFLGTGDYAPVRYFRPEAEGADVETPYVAFALARMLGSADVRIACTHAAERKHGAALCEEFTRAGLGAPRFERLEDGKSTDELWENFRRLRELVAAQGAREIVLDITHGFRSQPFFAGAVVSFVRAVSDTDSTMRIFYGAFEQRGADGRAPIWDLSPFVELVDWTHAIRQFHATGDARRLATLADRLARRLSADWALSGQEGEPPRFRQFAKALTEFGDALATIRTGELLLAQGRVPSAAARLAAAARAVREEIARYAPPLAEILENDIVRIARELILQQDHLAGEEGRRVMAALARRYLHFGRFSEAAIALREGWVNLYAVPSACRPGGGFDKEARKCAECQWTAACRQQRSIAEVRNDLEHGGFRPQPLPAATIRQRLEQLVSEFERAKPVAGNLATTGTVWFVSRHPGAVEWARRKGLAVQRQVAHLDVEQVDRGDTVIGTLPVNLAAKVCERGARYLNLSLDLPEEARGRELGADELERYGARLEAFAVCREKLSPDDAFASL